MCFKTVYFTSRNWYRQRFIFYDKCYINRDLKLTKQSFNACKVLPKSLIVLHRTGVSVDDNIIYMMENAYYDPGRVRGTFCVNYIANKG